MLMSFTCIVSMSRLRSVAEQCPSGCRTLESSSTSGPMMSGFESTLTALLADVVSIGISAAQEGRCMTCDTHSQACLSSMQAILVISTAVQAISWTGVLAIPRRWEPSLGF